MADCFHSSGSRSKYYFFMRVWRIDSFGKPFGIKWNNYDQSQSCSLSPLVRFSKRNFSFWLAKQKKSCWSMGLRTRKMGWILHAKNFLYERRSIANSQYLRSNLCLISHSQRNKTWNRTKTIYHRWYCPICWIHAQWLPYCDFNGRRYSKLLTISV